MREQPPLSNLPPASDLLGTLHRTTSALFMPRYIGFIVGGILLILLVAAIIIEDSAVASQPLQLNTTAQTGNTSGNTRPSSTESNPTANATSQAITSTNDTTNAQLNVNGQNIAVPANGTATQVVTDNGSQTTIHASNSSMQSVGGDNTSSSLSVNIYSRSGGASP